MDRLRLWWKGVEVWRCLRALTNMLGVTSADSSRFSRLSGGGFVALTALSLVLTGELCRLPDGRRLLVTSKLFGTDVALAIGVGVGVSLGVGGSLTEV